jgi:hypothetical protein
MTPHNFGLMMLRAAAAALVLATFCGCSESRETFVAERTAEAAGYRLEHFPREHLLFVHRPDGEKDGVQFGSVKHFFLNRVLGRDTVDAKPRYWWHFYTDVRTVAAPFFGTDPGTMIGILRDELPGFDEPGARKMVAEFEKNNASFCMLWASAEYLAENRIKKEEECRP